MAAFETISRHAIQPYNHESFLDLRFARLPSAKTLVENYEPREHRTPKDPIKVWMAYFNLLRISLGPGMLGVPLAISQAGIVLGPIITVTAGIIVMHMHTTLLWCLNEICRQLKIPYISYRYGFRVALLHGPAVCQAMGHRAPKMIAVFMILNQIGICTVLVIFTTDSLRDIMDWQSSKPAMLALLLPIIFLESMVKSLKVVSYISLMGNILNLVGLILILYHMFYEISNGDVDIVTYSSITWIIVFGSFLYNLSAVGVILTLERNLYNPKALTKRYGVLNLSMILNILSSTVFGVLGYWSFGVMDENILRSLPYDDYSTMVAIGLYLISTIFAYPLQCYPAIQILMEVIKNHTSESPSESTLEMIEYFVRPCFVTITFLVCYLIPFQGPFVAFVGNLCTSMLSLVFPALMELCLLYPGNYGKKNFYLIKDLIIITLGLVCWVFGVVLCGYFIYVRVLEKLSPNDIDYF